MGPPRAVRTISQEAFDDLVRENMEELGMDSAEALQDAIETLSLQGVDLSGIVTSTPAGGGAKDNPVIQCLDQLKRMDSDFKIQIHDKEVYSELMTLFNQLAHLCVEDSGNAAIAIRNGGVELVCSFCSKIPIECDRVLLSCLKALTPMLHGSV